MDDRAAELERLTAAARHARDRLPPYRAKALTGRETSPVRRRDLQRSADQTAGRLGAARRRHAEHGARPRASTAGR